MTVKAQVEWFEGGEALEIPKNKVTICYGWQKGDGSGGFFDFYFLIIQQVFTGQRFCARNPTVPATELGTFTEVP